MSFLHAVILFCNFAPATCMPQILRHINNIITSGDANKATDMETQYA